MFIGSEYFLKLLINMWFTLVCVKKCDLPMKWTIFLKYMQNAFRNSKTDKKSHTLKERKLVPYIYIHFKLYEMFRMILGLLIRFYIIKQKNIQSMIYAAILMFNHYTLTSWCYVIRHWRHDVKTDKWEKCNN